MKCCTNCGKETVNITRIPTPDFSGAEYLCASCTKDKIKKLNKHYNHVEEVNKC